MNKSQLRHYYRDQLVKLELSTRDRENREILHRIQKSSLYLRSEVIFTYLSNAQEVDTAVFITQAHRDGKRIAVPRIERGQIIPRLINASTVLEVGPYDLFQPPATTKLCDPSELDMVLVPGLAFTNHGARLGRGGGYFDRWLSTLPQHLPTIGLAFNCQIANSLPQEPHDVPVWRVTTP